MVELKGKTVILTGGTGFLGRYVARALLASGAEVYAVVRPSSPNEAFLPASEHLHILYTDLYHVADAYSAYYNKVPETNNEPETPFAFIHFAWGGVNRGEIDTDEVQQKNIDLSLACLYASKKLGCEVFMDAGSRVEYGIKENGIMKEDMPCNPVNAYGRAKLSFFGQAEKHIKKWGMTYYHLRFFSVYGIGDHPWSIISTLTRDLPRGEKVSLSACLQKWNFMEADDAALAVSELLKHSDVFAGGINTVNVASYDTRVLKDFVEEIYTLCAENYENAGTLEYGTFVQAKEGALSICPVISELNRLTEGGFKEQVSFGEGVLKLMEHPNLY